MNQIKLERLLPFLVLFPVLWISFIQPFIQQQIIMVEANPEPVEPTEPASEAAESQPVAEPDVYQAEDEKADLFSDIGSLVFKVRDPSNASGHIVYDIEGTDL